MNYVDLTWSPITITTKSTRHLSAVAFKRISPPASMVCEIDRLTFFLCIKPARPCSHEVAAPR
jgi:hypothetical protein